jgi:hypothetical protein
MTHHGPGSGGVTTILLIIFCALPRRTHTQVLVCPGTPKVESRNCPGFGLPGLWDIVASHPDLRLGRGLNQTCNPLQELSNAVSHSPSAHWERVDSRLLVVGVKLPVWLPALLLPITWAADVQLTNERPFRTSTLQDLFNDTKNAQMQGDLTPEIELWVFGSPGGLQLPTFGSVGFTLTLSPKWGCDKKWFPLEGA